MVYNMNVGSVKFRRNGEKSQNTERIVKLMPQDRYTPFKRGLLSCFFMPIFNY